MVFIFENEDPYTWNVILDNLFIQDNVFIISNFKSKYPVLQLDLR